MRTPRHRAREFAMQAIYQAVMDPTVSTEEIVDAIRQSDPFVKAKEKTQKAMVNEEFFEALVAGSKARFDEISDMLAQQLNAKVRDIFPVEKSIMVVAVYELMAFTATPYAVIINEAVELAKTYGAPEGHRLVNGMLDNIAAKLRPDEVVAAKKARQERRRRADDAAKTAVKPAESPNSRLGETQEAAAAEGEKSATAQTHGARNDAARAEARSAEPQEARADGKD